MQLNVSRLDAGYSIERRVQIQKRQSGSGAARLQQSTDRGGQRDLRCLVDDADVKDAASQQCTVRAQACASHLHGNTTSPEGTG